MKRRTLRGTLGALLAFSVLVVLPACLPPSAEDLAAVDYSPAARGDGWDISTPGAEGLDPDLFALLYYNTARLETLRGLLVIKNGQLVAEGYFNDGSIDQKARLQPVTKSFTSALVGLAIDQGLIGGISDFMLDHFPEVADNISDPRKFDIRIHHMLKMRAGYPWRRRIRTSGWSPLGALPTIDRSVPGGCEFRD